jgi:hypothetical protein
MNVAELDGDKVSIGVAFAYISECFTTTPLCLSTSPSTVPPFTWIMSYYPGAIVDKNGI